MVDKAGVSLWQDVAVEERGTDAAYRSTIAIKSFNHDQGTTWNTTIPHSQQMLVIWSRVEAQLTQ